MIAPNPFGLVDLFFRVPAEDAEPVRAALDIVGAQTNRLDELAISSEDLGDGSLLLTFPVTWKGWQEILEGCPDADDLKRMERARRILGKAVVQNVLESAAQLSPAAGDPN